MHSEIPAAYDQAYREQEQARQEPPAGVEHRVIGHVVEWAGRRWTLDARTYHAFIATRQAAIAIETAGADARLLQLALEELDRATTHIVHLRTADASERESLRAHVAQDQPGELRACERSSS